MTDLVNPYKETDESTKSSEPSSSTSETLSIEGKNGKKAQSPRTKCPKINPRSMLRKLETDVKNVEPESFVETVENDIKKLDGEVKAKNLYVVSHEVVEILSNVSNTEETKNTDDLHSIGPELQEMFKSPPAETPSKFKDKLKELENVTLNIAITGMTGAGKSSFVNALRGVCNGDFGAANTGTTETTMKPEMYTHPSMPNVKIWDLPGIGSPKFKAKTYLKDVNFKAYDFFLIVASERFKENDIELAKAIQKNKKLFYFIRSKIDNDVRAEGHKRDFDEQKLLNTIREDCENNLQKVKKPKVFLISSFKLDKYDFQRLIDTLEKELPENKRSALIQSLPVYSSDALTKKKTYFKKMIWLNAFAAGTGAIVPIPGVSVACDYGIMKKFFEKVFRGFGLSDDAIRSLSERVNKPVDHLKAAKTSQFKDGVTEAIVIDMLSEPIIATAKALGTIMSLLPGGALPAAGTAIASVHYLLNRGLNEMAEDTKNVLIVSELAVSD